jgi:hypothetical protein
MICLRWLIPLSLLSSFALAVSAQSLKAPEWIYGDNDARRNGLFALGFDQDTANSYADESQSMSTGIQWFPLNSGEKSAIIFLPCGGRAGALVGLIREQKGHPVMVTDEGADCLYKDQVSVEVLPLLPHGQVVVLLHYDCVSHGTGYAEHHLEIFEVRGNSLIKRFDALEHLYAAAMGEGTEEFRYFVPMHTAEGTWALEDTCVVTDIKDGMTGSQRQVFRRSIRWSATANRFVVTSFRSVDGSSGSCPRGEADHP